MAPSPVHQLELLLLPTFLSIHSVLVLFRATYSYADPRPPFWWEAGRQRGLEKNKVIRCRGSGTLKEMPSPDAQITVSAPIPHLSTLHRTHQREAPLHFPMSPPPASLLTFPPPAFPPHPSAHPSTINTHCTHPFWHCSPPYMPSCTRFTDSSLSLFCAPDNPDSEMTRQKE